MLKKASKIIAQTTMLKKRSGSAKDTVVQVVIDENTNTKELSVYAWYVNARQSKQMISTANMKDATAQYKKIITDHKRRKYKVTDEDGFAEVKAAPKNKGLLKDFKGNTATIACDEDDWGDDVIW